MQFGGKNGSKQHNTYADELKKESVKSKWKSQITETAVYNSHGCPEQGHTEDIGYRILDGSSFTKWPRFFKSEFILAKTLRQLPVSTVQR
jgi:hypothetical protein